MATDNTSTRVNSVRLKDYINQTVRLACKVIEFGDETMKVEASDGGEVIVNLPPDTEHKSDLYVEVIGVVQDATTINLTACIPMGNKLDMKLVNDTVELIHDPRFYSKMFRP